VKACIPISGRTTETPTNMVKSMMTRYAAKEVIAMADPVLARRLHDMVLCPMA
jgi:hypothetical protein